MSKTKILLEGMGINPLEKIDNNCDSYWTLYELIDHCIEQLSIPRVVGQSGQLNIDEHKISVMKTLSDLKKHYPNKDSYRIASNCGVIQYFVDGEIVKSTNI